MNQNTKNGYIQIIINVLLAISGVGTLIAYGFASYKVIISFLLLFYLCLVLKSILNIRKNYLLLLFLFTFFLFTMGQYVFPNRIIWFYYTQFPSNIVKKTVIIQFLSLLAIYLGFESISYFFRKRTENYSHIEVNERIKKILIVLLYLFFIIAVFINLEISFRTMKYGYLVLYNNDVRSLFPPALSYLAYFFPILVFINLAICKDRKKFYLILVTYFIYLVSTLLTGERNEFGLGIIIIMIYIFINIFIKDNYRFNKKQIVRISILAAVIGFVGFVGLGLFNSVRNNQQLKLSNPLIEFENFFTTQGASVNLISIGLENYKDLKEDGMYTIGPVFDNVESKLAKFKLKFDIPDDFKTSFAVEATKIGLGEDAYYNGQGLGSQYLAELFLDYGYLGVIIYSFLLGAFIYLLSGFYRYNFALSALCTMLIQSILFLPRSQALQPINAILSVNYWVIIFAVIILMLLDRRKKYE